MSDSASQSPASTVTETTGRGEKIAKVGTILSAIMASSCCWLPLVLLAVGVSGAGIASTLEAYRPYFMVVTFGFLGAAFYFTYRPRKSTAETGQGCCDTEPAVGENCCAPTSKRRLLSMMTLNKVMLWIVTVLAVAFLFFPSYVGLLFGTEDESAVTDDMNRAVFKIEGMTCEGCSTTVAQAIRGVPGVVAAEVSYEKREAVVGTKASDPMPTQRILSALERAGYTGTIVDSSNGTSVSESQRQANAVPTDDLVDLSQDVRQLKSAFNAVKGKVRLLLIVSPG